MLKLKSNVFISTALVAMLLSSKGWAEEQNDLFNLSIKDLQNLKITSVSKKPENPFEAAAAVYVITGEDIRRSGVTSIPEALRMAPGVDVAQIDSGTWAITARGFNEQFSNKLLVMIDGRTVYTPLFSGVYWNVQDTVLEDVARIEVIRGPGATLWGVNAVNGVINIITKNAKNTQGNYASALIGNYEDGTVEGRHGGKVESQDNMFYRVYAKFLRRDDHTTPVTTAPSDKANDNWYSIRSGFRVDWDKSQDDTLAFHGDVYRGSENQDYASVITGDGEEDFKGGNVVARWDRSMSDVSDASLQFYVDYIERDMATTLNQERLTLDFEFQHNWRGYENQEITWGLGYRFFADDLDEKYSGSIKALDYTPDSSDNHLYSAFIQDKIRLDDDLYFTLGSKFENHYYTGNEIQPNARLTWLPSSSHTVWASVSHASRTPTRGEQGLTLYGGPLNQKGSSEFDSEKLTAYEIGYRVEPAWWTSHDIALFYNDYDKLRTFESFDNSLDVITRNNAVAESYGAELSSRFSITRDWNVYANYSFFTLDVHVNDGFSEPYGDAEANETASPKNKFNLLSRFNLFDSVEFDQNLYYVDNVTRHSIPAYIRIDSRVGWKPMDGFDLSLVGQNLFDDLHPEFSGALYSKRTQIPRSVYVKLSWQY
jgi:iron complex outermembrane receptor protein